MESILNEASLMRVFSHTQKRNIGLISAFRNEYTISENKKRNKELESDIRKAGFGFINIRGRYVENYGTEDARSVDEHVFLVISESHNDEKLKRFLIKHGIKYDQDSILFKSYDDKNAYLYGTKEDSWPGLNNSFNVGVWHPNRAGEFFSIIKGNRTFTFESKRPQIKIEFFNSIGFFSRKETEF